MPIQTMMRIQNRNDKNGWLPIQKNQRSWWYQHKQQKRKKEEKCDHWGILVTHFYRDKMTDFVSWNISRNALDTLYGQKVFLLYDLVAQGTFAVISHFFSLTSFSFFFLPMVLIPSYFLPHNLPIGKSFNFFAPLTVLEFLFWDTGLGVFLQICESLTVVLHMLDHFLASN